MDSTLAVATGDRWLQTVLADFPSFLQDHASCERKASGAALSLAAHYPDRPALVDAMANLAVEELGHYRDVIRLLIDRGIQPAPDTRDAYVNALSAVVRGGRDNYLVDRLLVASVIECRGQERFSMIAHALEDDHLARFYRRIAASEDRHWQLFLELAHHECPDADIDGRWEEIVAREADVVQSLKLRPALH
ncbi:MAG: tRNA-(ms[2]io[6]A)-hydroxylase [Gammaproteobacteria bacterium]|nr:tRNA-(ms[2]io[6]A)-hydroxylase [Gammaproteobacteria bacterium]MDE0225348.1 tRNA-(ms[2]io[6]A)-hydroxylase [Gammaproteobacteria bacterium]MDE0450153.1 tRNA-(ms[2]io[6]A)-hydroxylase [Gammaproteobacteria bacterium]